MKIVIDKNKLEEALTRVEMKGKYYDGNKAKNFLKSISKVNNTAS